MILLAYWFNLPDGPRLFLEWSHDGESHRVTIEANGRVRSWK